VAQPNDDGEEARHRHLGLPLLGSVLGLDRKLPLLG
jgi:hypothetical protein